MTAKLQMFILCLSLSGNIFANSYFPAISLEAENKENRWSLTASLGYAQYQHLISENAKTFIGRLAVAAGLAATAQSAFGLEVGVQTGNRMTLALQDGQDDLEFVRTAVRPMLDVLFTASTLPLGESLLFTQLKGGVAYRQWDVQKQFLNSRSEFAAELQAGLGYPVTEMTSLSFLYQGIFGGNPKFHIVTVDSGHLSNIPIQHGVLLGFTAIV